MARILFLWIFLFPFCLEAQDSTKTKPERALGIKAGLVIPVFYGLHPDFKEWVTPSFQLSYLVNLQYKTSRNWLWELELQPYSFNYTGPNRLITQNYYSGPHGSNSYLITENVYQKLSFKYCRMHIGFGKKYYLKNKFLAFTFGAAFFVGSFNESRISMHMKTFTATGQPPQNQYDSLYVFNTMPHVSPFVSLTGGYFLTKNLALTGGLYYSPVLLLDLEGSGNVGSPIYAMLLQHVVSASIGITFNLVGKNPGKE